MLTCCLVVRLWLWSGLGLDLMFGWFVVTHTYFCCSVVFRPYACRIVVKNAGVVDIWCVVILGRARRMLFVMCLYVSFADVIAFKVYFFSAETTFSVIFV